MARQWLPITPSTVTIDSNERSALDYVWSMLRVHEGVPERGFRDIFLSVPARHPSENIDCGDYHLRPKQKYSEYVFERQRSGAWMLVLPKVTP